MSASVRTENVGKAPPPLDDDETRCTKSETVGSRGGKLKESLDSMCSKRDRGSRSGTPTPFAKADWLAKGESGSGKKCKAVQGDPSKYFRHDNETKCVLLVRDCRSCKKKYKDNVPIQRTRETKKTSERLFAVDRGSRSRTWVERKSPWRHRDWELEKWGQLVQCVLKMDCFRMRAPEGRDHGGSVIHTFTKRGVQESCVKPLKYVDGKDNEDERFLMQFCKTH